jgi:hypothetical protein
MEDLFVGKDEQMSGMTTWDCYVYQSVSQGPMCSMLELIVSLTLFRISTIIAGVQNTVASFTNTHNIAISRYMHIQNQVNHCPVMVYSASCLRPTRGEPQVVVGGGAVLVAAGCSGPPLVVVGWTGCVLKYLSRPGTSFEIILSMLLSATKAGMLPPGVLDVAISQRVFLSGSSVMRSTLT